MSLQTILALLVSTTFVYAAPLIFTAVGGTFSERGGIVNVGLEGIMVMGAFAAIVFNLTFADKLGSLTPWLGLIAGAVAGLVIAWLHGVATIYLRADHVISGTVINLIAPALGVFLIRIIYNQGQTAMISQNFGYTDINILNKIPFIGPIFFHNASAPAWLAIIVTIIMWYVLYKTRYGLRLRSVGEHPQAADTLGLNVYHLRMSGVLISGVLGGIGGAIYAQSIALNFGVATIAGQGFIALAAMIFGQWNPLGAFGAALFFGLSQSLSVIGSQLPFIKTIPAVYLNIFPYVLTVVILTLFFGKGRAPKADGVNYIKSV